MDAGPAKERRLAPVEERGQAVLGGETTSIIPSMRRIWRISLAGNRLSPTFSRPTSILALPLEAQHVPERGDERSPGVAKMSNRLSRLHWQKRTRASPARLNSLSPMARRAV